MKSASALVLAGPMLTTQTSAGQAAVSFARRGRRVDLVRSKIAMWMKAGARKSPTSARRRGPKRL